jgi:hypothetical protein
VAVSKLGIGRQVLRLSWRAKTGTGNKKRNGLKLDQEDEFVFFFFSVIGVTEAYLVVFQHYELAHFTPKRTTRSLEKKRVRNGNYRQNLESVSVNFDIVFVCE